MSSVNYKKTRRATKKAVRVAVTPPIHNLYELKVKPSLLSFPTMSEMTTTDITTFNYKPGFAELNPGKRRMYWSVAVCCVYEDSD